MHIVIWWLALLVSAKARNEHSGGNRQTVEATGGEEIKIFLQNVESTLDNYMLVSNVLEANSDIIVFNEMKEDFIRYVHSSSFLKRKYNFNIVGAIAILTHKDRIQCSGTVAYQTLQKDNDDARSISRTTSVTTNRPIETVLLTSCGPSSGVKNVITAAMKKNWLNIVTFNAQPYKISRSYCKLFYSAIKTKENIILAGNVRQNLQLHEDCFRRKLVVFDAWEVFNDMLTNGHDQGNTFDVEHNNLAKYIDTINTNYTYNKRRDKIYVKNLNYRIHIVKLFRGNQNRSFYKNTRYYQSADYGVILSLRRVQESHHDTLSFCYIRKRLQESRKELSWLDKFMIMNTSFFYENDDNNELKKKFPALKLAFDLIKQFKSISKELFKHFLAYVKFVKGDESRVSESYTQDVESMDENSVAPPTPQRLKDPPNLKAIFNDNDEQADPNVAARKLVMKDPDNLDAFFDDKNSMDKVVQEHKDRKPIDDKHEMESDDDDPKILGLKKLQRLRTKILKRKRDKYLSDNRYNPMKGVAKQLKREKEAEVFRALTRL